MSSAYDSMYEIEVARQKAIFNERVCSKTEEFYNRYVRQYEEMVNNEFELYIPNEMNRLKEDLNEIRSLLADNNGVEAREESMAVGQYIRSMFALGRNARLQFERTERLNKELQAKQAEETKNDNLKYYYEAINRITDPVIRDFAKPELMKLRDFVTNTVDASSMNAVSMRKYIDNLIEGATTRARIKSEQWKNKIIEENKKECQVDMIEQIEEELKFSKIEDEHKSNKILEMIEKIKLDVASNSKDIANVHSKIKEISKEIDDIVICENIRREAVKAIVDSLRKQEFTIESVNLIEANNSNFVKVVAKKPSGKKAECRVGLDGNLKYKFDNYKGMACIQDIEQFDIDLKEIYSVSLSNVKKIWENPIRISKDAREIENTNRRGL